MSNLQIRRPDDFEITVVGSEADREHLDEIIGDDVNGGKIMYMDRDKERELMEDIFSENPEALQGGPIVLITAPNDETVSACSLSYAGDSVIIHCEDKVIPLEKRPDAPPAPVDDALDAAPAPPVA